MRSPVASRLPRSARIGLLVAGIGGVLVGLLAWGQWQREREIDADDLERRAYVLANQMTWLARQALEHAGAEQAQLLADRLDGHRRVLGYAIHRADGTRLAGASDLDEFNDVIHARVRRVLNEAEEAAEFLLVGGNPIHLLVTRVRNTQGAVIGTLSVVHDTAYLEQRAAARFSQFALVVLFVTLVLMTVVVGITWFSYERPLEHLAQWMRRLRTDDMREAPPVGLPTSRLATESQRLAASYRAARSAGWQQSHDLVREHNVWTRERLRAYAIDCLQGRQLVIVSNREPYMHELRDGVLRMIMPAGGLVTALDPVLQACGGLWVAHGAGDADRQTADAQGRLLVPPDDPRYTLKRVWLSRAEEQGYYYGLSNEGLWPLCHLAHERPNFRAADWAQYQRANQRFADAVLQEIGDGPAVVLVQDYQLALLPALLRQARPDVPIGLFWHIPWPNPEAIRICPWRAEILQGMLGADVLGFHLQQYCNNFLDSVDRMLEARIDRDDFAVTHRGQRALVRPFPISVESWAERDSADGERLAERIAHFRSQHALGETRVIAGVERIDYTKGLPERLRAFDRFLETQPHARERVTFVLLAAPSRTHIRRYRELVAELEAQADEINWKHQTDGWRPLRLLIAHHNAATVHAVLSMADVCVVSPLHDGMNLVSKEYVAARTDGDGVLVLSEFAGAARELSEALIINPYDTEQFAAAIQQALDMPADERRRRMRAMQTIVQENNVYRWAAGLLTTLAGARPTPGHATDRERNP